ncbi:MAG: O-antigen ligase family protein [Nitrospinota bacterium]
MRYIKVSDFLLKFLVVASPVLYFPYAEEPFRPFRETLFHIVILGVFIFTVAHYVDSRLHNERPERKFTRDGPTAATAVLFALSAAFFWVSLAFNEVTPIALKTAVNFTLGLALFAAFVEAMDRWPVHEWIPPVLAAAVLNSALAVAQYAGWDPLFFSLDPDFHSKQPKYLVAGLMDSPNMLTPYLVSAVPLVFGRWISGNTPGNFFKYGFLLVLLLTPVALSQNLAGWLGLFAAMSGLLVYLTLRARYATGGALFKKVIGCWILAAIILVSGMFMYASRDDGSKEIKSFSISERIDQNRAAWMMFAESPLTGKGPNYFYRHYVEYRRAVWLENPPPILPLRTAHQVHNEYLQLLAEGGLLTGVPLALLLFYWLWSHLLYLKKRLKQKELNSGEILFLGAAGGFWSIMVNAVANFPFHVEPLAVTAIFWAAAAHRMIRHSEDDG